MLRSLFLLLLFTTPSTAQGLFLTLHYRITPEGLRGPFRIIVSATSCVWVCVCVCARVIFWFFSSICFIRNMPDLSKLFKHIYQELSMQSLIISASSVKFIHCYLGLFKTNILVFYQFYGLSTYWPQCTYSTFQKTLWNIKFRILLHGTIIFNIKSGEKRNIRILIEKLCMNGLRTFLTLLSRLTFILLK